MRALGFTLHQMVGEPGVMEVRLELARVKPG
jgi:hypothetical protein